VSHVELAICWNGSSWRSASTPSIDRQWHKRTPWLPLAVHILARTRVPGPGAEFHLPPEFASWYSTVRKFRAPSLRRSSGIIKLDTAINGIMLSSMNALRRFPASAFSSPRAYHDDTQRSLERQSEKRLQRPCEIRSKGKPQFRLHTTRTRVHVTL
jgi:hypothetical protein